MHLSKRRIGLGLMTTTLLATSPVLAETIPSDLSSVDPQATAVGDVVVLEPTGEEITIVAVEPGGDHGGAV